jgi:uncharacterized cupin superfamily protein
MPNIYEALEPTNDGVSAARVGESAGSDKLGMSVYELQPGQGMVFHYHLQREELLIVLRGTVALRTAAGWEELAEGDVAASRVESAVPMGMRTGRPSRRAW